jgi:hypothetical protein
MLLCCCLLCKGGEICKGGELCKGVGKKQVHIAHISLQATHTQQQHSSTYYCRTYYYTTDYTMADATTTPAPAPATLKGVREMEYTELQQECKRRKVSAKGNKAQLMQRVAESRVAAGEASSEAAGAPAAAATPSPTEGVVDVPAPGPAPGSASVGGGVPSPEAAFSAVSFGGSGGSDGANGPQSPAASQSADESAESTPDNAGAATSTEQQAPAAGAETDATQTQKKKCPTFVESEMVRLAHCLADSGCQSALGRIKDRETKETLDDPKAGNPWEDIAEAFNDSNLVFRHIETMPFSGCDHPEHSWWCGTPRNETKALDPNIAKVGRDGKKLKDKWTEMRGFLSVPMKKWDKSGEQNPNRSPSDFIDDSVSHPKVVKYMCLLFQGNKDLLDFSSKLMPAGVAKDSGAGRVKLQHAQPPESGSKKRKAEMEVLREIFAGDRAADKELAAAAKEQAAAFSAEAAGVEQRNWNATLTSLTQSLKDLSGVPGAEEAIKTLSGQLASHLANRPAATAPPPPPPPSSTA